MQVIISKWFDRCSAGLLSSANVCPVRGMSSYADGQYVVYTMYNSPQITFQPVYIQLTAIALVNAA